MQAVVLERVQAALASADGQALSAALRPGGGRELVTAGPLARWPPGWADALNRSAARGCLAKGWRRTPEIARRQPLGTVRAMADTIIATNVVKRYGTLTAVDDVSLSVGARRVLRHPRPERGRQDDPAGDHRGPAARPIPATSRCSASRSGRETPSCCTRIGVQLQASSFFERLTAREQLQTFARAVRHAARPGRRDAGDGRR